MVFSSPVFLFAFLPLALLAYLPAPRALRPAILLTASLVFYAWGEKGYVLLMAASIAVNYVLGLWVGAWREWRVGWVVLTFGIVANVALLGFFKYANFFVDNVNGLLEKFNYYPILHLKPVHLPIGISFFTFEAIAYLVDVRRGLTQAQRDPIRFGLFMTLFPHLIAGPVVRYRDLAAALERCEVNFEQFASGVRRFVVGLAKKVLLANALARTADLVFAQKPEYLDASAAWLGVACYAMQIYFDFSGYSDMAIGLGRLFGFELIENFRYPYTAASITDFWRRWHISLSSWFRDFVYIPLGGNRRGPVATTFNLMTVFLLCGLWHGASWNFLVWGLWHGCFLVLERFVRNVPLNRPLAALLWLPRHAYTLAVVLLSWVFFRAENLTHAGDLLAAMFGGMDGGHSWSDYWTPELALALAVGCVGALPLVPLLRSWRERHGNPLIFELGELLTLLALLAACIVAMAGGTFDPFIYFRF